MLKDFCILICAEVSVFATRLGVCQNDPVNELLKAPLTIVGAYRSTKVLGGDDGRGIHCPEVGIFDTALFKDNLTSLPVVLQNVTPLPCHFLVRVNTFGGEQPLHMQPWSTKGVMNEILFRSDHGGFWCLCHGRAFLDCCHALRRCTCLGRLPGSFVFRFSIYLL